MVFSDGVGYYIHTCQKMKYKAEYEPSFLLDPKTYEFLPFNEVCKPMLDIDDHAIFSEFEENQAQRRESFASESLPSQDATSGHENEGMDTDGESEEDVEDNELSKPPPPGFLDPDNLPQDLLIQIYTFENGKPLPLIVSVVSNIRCGKSVTHVALQLSRTWRSNAAKRKKIQEGIAAMGSAAADTCLFA